jgi:hypothetical protein
VAEVDLEARNFKIAPVRDIPSGTNAHLLWEDDNALVQGVPESAVGFADAVKRGRKGDICPA